MEHYFLNFPVFNYNGYTSVNILDRVAFADKYKTNPALFHMYQIPDGKTAAMVAHDLYGKPQYEWVIYLFNDIIDPYYQWPLSSTQFVDFINDKYGSFESAQLPIYHFENNWYQHTLDILDTNGYAALPANLKKYWKPQILPGNKVFSYVRTPAGTTTTTNFIIQFTTSNLTGTFKSDGVLQGPTGQCQFVYFNKPKTIYTHKIKGSFAPGDTINAYVDKTVKHFDDDPVSFTVDSLSTTFTIDPLEQVYFTGISNLDFETRLNNKKGTIKLLKAKYLPDIEQAFSKAFA